MFHSCEDNVFIDRDADVFSMVISYLRNDMWYPEIEDETLRKRFERELEFLLLKKQDSNSLIELQKVYEKEPRFLDQKQLMPAVMNRWRQLGPFEVQKNIRKHNLQFDAALELIHDREHDEMMLYSGQDCTTRTGRYIYTDQLLEGQFAIYEDDNEEDDCGLDGYGRVIYEAGDYYEGFFHDGKRHGQGKFVYANGVT